MIAVDTNVLLRFLTRDDPDQAVRAKALLGGGSVFVPRTVVLEVAWVLRGTDRFSRGAVAAALARLLGLPGVVVEDGATVARALVRFGRGLEFADALHLASSGQARAFATFDRALQRAAGRLHDAIPVIAP
jgi:predicted nucleic acid-binding protein